MCAHVTTSNYYASVSHVTDVLNTPRTAAVISDDIRVRETSSGRCGRTQVIDTAFVNDIYKKKCKLVYICYE